MAVKKNEGRSEISDILKKYSKAGLKAGTFDDVVDEVKGLTTGNMSIDHSVGVDGLPVGRIIEAYGPTSSGKTTLALQTAAALQQKIILEDSTDRILYIDYEHTLDVDYCASLGLDLLHDSVIVTQPRSLEKGANLARELVGTGHIRLVIWDSVAEAQPESTLEIDTGQVQVAAQARVMGQFLGQIVDSLFVNDCTLILINHMKESIPTGYVRVTTKTTNGGFAPKFYSSVRIEFAPISTSKGKRYNALTNEMEEVSVATETKVTMVKNKVGTPKKSCVVKVRYGKGFDNFWSALQVLLSHNKVTKTGAWYYFSKTPELLLPGLPESAGKPGAFQGEDKLLQYADGHNEWRQLVIDYAVDLIKISSENAPSVVETDEDDDDPFNLGKVDFR